jgi:hypothetical protein
MNARPDDKTVIKDFLKQQKGNPKIEKYPDKENRKSKDIDAIAGSLAIEHTSIDTVIEQRSKAARFMRVVNGLEKELNPQMNYYLRVVLPWEAITTGQKWQKIRTALKNWIVNSSFSLSDGSHEINNIPDIPFGYTAIRDKRFKSRLIFARLSPKDNSLPDRMLSLIKRKTKKLKPYKSSGYTTILIIESNDIALMNEEVLAEAVIKKFPSSLEQELDELWYADTCAPEDIIFKKLIPGGINL